MRPESALSPCFDQLMAELVGQHLPDPLFLIFIEHSTVVVGVPPGHLGVFNTPQMSVIAVNLSGHNWHCMTKVDDQTAWPAAADKNC